MEQLSGEKVKFARLPEDAISPVIETELLQHVPQATAMISVVSPPDDRRKDRFHPHQAGVIRQSGEFQPCAELDTFVSRIKEICA
jgi:hypothetical protein